MQAFTIKTLWIDSHAVTPKSIVELSDEEFERLEESGHVRAPTKEELILDSIEDAEVVDEAAAEEAAAKAAAEEAAAKAAAEEAAAKAAAEEAAAKAAAKKPVKGDKPAADDDL
jgi:hypothetical protein